MYNFPWVRRKFQQTPFFFKKKKKTACSVDPLGVQNDVRISKLPQEGRQTKKKGHFLEPMLRNWAPKPPEGPIATEQLGPQGAHAEFWRPRGPVLHSF